MMMMMLTPLQRVESLLLALGDYDDYDDYDDDGVGDDDDDDDLSMIIQTYILKFTNHILTSYS